MTYPNPYDSANPYTESYWMLAEDPKLNRLNKTGQLLFYGYANQAARDNLDAPIGQKVYPVVNTNSDEYMTETTPFDDYFDETVLKVLDKTNRSKAYDFADAYFDGDIKTGYTQEDDGTYTRDSDGETVLVSEARKTFFDGATDV